MKPSPEMSASPLDARPAPPLAQLSYKAAPRWVPSRFNARTVGDDGRMMVWNTLTGVAFEIRAEHREAALAALSSRGVPEPLDPFAKNLAARGFLVPEGASELDRMRMLFGQQHWRSDVLQLILLASEDCNFRCVYCYEKFKNGTMLPEVRQGVRALVEQNARRLNALSLRWFGGEPLYGWEAIEELAPFFQAKAREHGMEFSHDMTTNGYLLTEERATRLLEWGCLTYQISVDGVREDHDCKRVARDGSATYDVILDNLRSLAARPDPFRVDLRVNYDRGNFERLGSFLESIAQDFGGDRRFRLLFKAVGRWGGPNDADLDLCGTEETARVKDQLRQRARELGLNPHGGIEEQRAPGSAVCYAARPYNFIVGATGKLMKCTIALDEMEENVVGRILPDGRLEFNDHHLARWVTPQFESDALCQTCYVLPTCQGAACPLTRIQSDKRTCAGIKSNLKREMRFSLDTIERARQAALALAAAQAQAQAQAQAAAPVLEAVAAG